MTRISAPGSERRRRGHTRDRQSGFTLIELLVVVAIIGLASGLVVSALRDSDATRLDQEGARLAALFDSARAESRASGVAVAWTPVRAEDVGSSAEADFRFVGLPAGLALPTRWLDRQTTAEIEGARSITLGPEPLIGAQRLVLRLGDRRLILATDGLGPFALSESADSPSR